MSDETTPDLTARMDALSPEAIHVAEDVWTEDEPTLAEYELAEAVLTAARAAGFGPVRAVEAERDAAQELAGALTDELGVAANRCADATDRAESAEAALAGLREGIERLAVRIERRAIRPVNDPAYSGGAISSDLRALLAPTPDREEASDE